MKKLFLTLGLSGLSLAAISTLTSCGGSERELNILNWGEYLSTDLIQQFEEEFNCTINETPLDSNEAMYKNINEELDHYDIVIPSDYMISQMKEEGLIKKLDMSKLPNYKADTFVPELVELTKSDACKSYDGYYVPYFWGSLGIMYNNRVEGLEELVQENGWNILFEKNLWPEGLRVGMYASSRDSLAAAELYKGYDLNTKDKNQIKECFDLIQSVDYKTWQTDELKNSISNNNLDLALVYSGDFFDAFYISLENLGDDADASEVLEQYNIYAPTSYNNVFFDAMCIPTTTQDEELAYEFINFMISHDNAMENADAVGYCPTVKSVYDEIMADEEGWGDITQIDAYDPVKILSAEGSRAVVYDYLGSDIVKYYEDLYSKLGN